MVFKILALVLNVLILVSVVPSSASLSIPNSEYQSLRSLYTNLKGESWTNAYGWESEYTTEFNNAVHPCSWYGLSCNETSPFSSISLNTSNTDVINTTHIVSMILSENNVVGSLPGHILSNFTLLGHLDLGLNSLTGTLPEELCTFGSNMVILSLWKNTISGIELIFVFSPFFFLKFNILHIKNVKYTAILKSSFLTFFEVLCLHTSFSSFLGLVFSN